MIRPCPCVWDQPVLHGGHCCGLRCETHDESVIVPAIDTAGGWSGWVHTAPSWRRELLMEALERWRDGGVR